MVTNVRYREQSTMELDDVWAGTSAQFDVYTAEEDQFVAFYAADRSITVGQRRLGEDQWTYITLPEDRKVKWDAHNDLVLAVDEAGHVHLSGNMHVHPLKYYRTSKPVDVTTFERIETMVGSDEDRVTYPQFIDGPDGELVYKYRDGSSGAGNWIYNVYDTTTQSWERLLDEPLTYGGDAMNAYPHGPMLGPDGRYHLCWVWRDHPGAQTNHDISYARSPDLRTWETAAGTPLSLPITINSGDLIDPVPPYGGMINGNTKIGFDYEDRIIISYHKFDADGNTQVYNARFEQNRWHRYRTSDWQYRWAFGGGGSIPFEITIGPVERHDGSLVQTYDHIKYGAGKWVLDEKTLQPTAWYTPWNEYPPDITTVDSDRPDMQVNIATDSGQPSDDRHYILRWEALRPNRDRPRRETPPPTKLTIHGFDFPDD